MDPMIAAAAIKTGTTLLSGLFDRPTQVLSPKWEQQRALYRAGIQERYGEERERAFARTRLETARAGLSRGGAYLESVTEIDKRINELMMRELSQYEMNQAMQRSQWAMQAAQMQTQQSQAYHQRQIGRLGSIGGTWAGALMGKYTGELQEEYSGKLDQLIAENESLRREIQKATKQQDERIGQLSQGLLLSKDEQGNYVFPLSMRLGLIPTRNQPINTITSMSGK